MKRKRFVNRQQTCINQDNLSLGRSIGSFIEEEILEEALPPISAPERALPEENQ